MHAKPEEQIILGGNHSCTGPLEKDQCKLAQREEMYCGVWMGQKFLLKDLCQAEFFILVHMDAVLQN